MMMMTEFVKYNFTAEGGIWATVVYMMTGTLTSEEKILYSLVGWV
jgi:hypothetical protein